MAVLTPSGVYAPGRNPPKSEIIQLLEQIMGSASAPAVVKLTKAALDLVTPVSENYGGLVLNDPDPTKNGYYYRSTATWVKGRSFPDTFANVVLPPGAGSDRVGSVAMGVNPASVEVFFANVTTPNDGPITLSIGGHPPRDVVNLAGNPLASGEWTGMVMFYLNDDDQYQLLIDAGAAASSAASASAAGADRVLAEDAADRAEAAAAGVEYPVSYEPQVLTPTRREQARYNIGAIGIIAPGGRPTIVSATPVLQQTADYSSATLWYAPYLWNILPIFDDSAGVWRFHRFTSGPLDQVGLSMVGGAKWTANGKRDGFVFNDGGTLRIGTGAVWPGDSEASRGLVRRDGIWVNSASVTLDISASETRTVAANCATWVTSINPASTGTLTATFAPGQNRRCDIWSPYNQVEIILSAGCPQASPSLPVVWNPANRYIEEGFKAFNNDTNNAGSWFTGLPQNIETEYSQWAFVDQGVAGGACAAIITICETSVSNPTKWGALSSDAIAGSGDGRMKSNIILHTDYTFKGRVGSGKAIMAAANANATTGITMIGFDPRPSFGSLERGHELQIRYKG